jgi:hypothetical protein
MKFPQNGSRKAQSTHQPGRAEMAHKWLKRLSYPDGRKEKSIWK